METSQVICLANQFTVFYIMANTGRLFVNRKSNYVYLGLDIPFLSARVSSELTAIIRNFEKENRDSKHYFVFPRLVHTTKWKHDYIVFEKKDI